MRNPESRFVKEIPAEFMQNHSYDSLLNDEKTGKRFFDSFSHQASMEAGAGVRVLKPKVNNDIDSFSM